MSDCKHVWNPDSLAYQMKCRDCHVTQLQSRDTQIQFLEAQVRGLVEALEKAKTYVAGHYCKPDSDITGCYHCDLLDELKEGQSHDPRREG
jgi:hypothetical protein